MKQERIQRKRTKGWRMPKNTIYVGRPTKWGNPFEIGSNPSQFSAALPSRCENIDTVLKCYRYYAESWIEVTGRQWIKRLKGKNLACFCPLDKPCHADILLKIAND